MKCLPSNKLHLAQGSILHDWHAEVVAVRAFNRFLLDQCLLISTPPYPSSDFLRRLSNDEQSGFEQQPFTIREHVQVHMYCSEAPCGDASMELTMDAQEDATPWTSVPPIVSSGDASTEDNTTALRGRSNFSLLGAVRCKPSRLDAPPTLSKSCTDKLALKQATSLLSSTTSALVSPRNAYLHSLILPASQFVPSACSRAFSRAGRMHALTDATWKGGYRFQPFEVNSTEREFRFSRRTLAPHEKAMSSNLSAVWTPSWQETLIGGVLQGRKQLDPRGASAICRRSMWKTAVQIAGIAGVPMLVDMLDKERYRDLKRCEMLDERRKVKDEAQRTGLSGWVKNLGDDTFTLSEPSK
ncbi:hypothetical protein P153DRAFT_91951 [Dothidotthia symphoricarpi CBS 119687]|uniref:A to I editase domain-containing protein n=1 Tax=Dothidotthia symphoricarpi CBS 119687 TaxID=1392245 RepID=A0A6A6A2G1_9PLEO|nr:uncharacterized protein P153DRAFT_91951 [Dothidotthia symphoricarpi CBS 119687]KAF2125726.1 hypothetical protein P153DRAFT_91951 [Dothidotthia symphoricarpi CBS 119687]